MSLPVFEIDEDTLRALIVLKDHQLFPVVQAWIKREYEKFKRDVSVSWDAPDKAITACQGMTEILDRIELILRDPKHGLEYKLSKEAARKSVKLPSI